MGVRVVRPAVPRGPIEVEVLDEVDAPNDGRSQLAVGGEDPVRLLQSERAPALGGLLADQRGIDGQLALALEGGGLEVRPAGPGHQPVQLEEALLLYPQRGEVRL